MKKRPIVCAVIFSFFFLNTTMIERVPMTNIDVAKAYYGALYGKDFDKVRALASPDMVFEART